MVVLFSSIDFVMLTFIVFRSLSSHLPGLAKLNLWFALLLTLFPFFFEKFSHVSIRYFSFDSQMNNKNDRIDFDSRHGLFATRNKKSSFIIHNFRLWPENEDLIIKSNWLRITHIIQWILSIDSGKNAYHFGELLMNVDWALPFCLLEQMKEENEWKIIL